MRTEQEIREMIEELDRKIELYTEELDRGLITETKYDLIMSGICSQVNAFRWALGDDEMLF